MPRLPAYRDLDIYWLVLLRRWKKKRLARAFGLHPTRVSQIIRRVTAWVDCHVAFWLFRGEPDLRFLVALEKSQLRIVMPTNDPLEIVIEHSPGRITYTRVIDAPVCAEPQAPVSTHSSAQFSPPPSAHVDPHDAPHVSAQPGNFLEPAGGALPAATADPPTVSTFNHTAFSPPQTA